MDLGEFKKLIEETPDNTVFKAGISKPFSWRGSYNEVAFEITESAMTKEEVLANIQEAYEQEFHGYKGGVYRYDGETPVNFEEDYSCWTDGDYVLKKLFKIIFQ